MNKKILIIEDDLILLNLLRDKLSKAGYSIVSAENGKIGLRMVETENPDLVLLDVILPEMDGMNVLENIRKNPLIAATPVIIISNSGQPVEIEEAEKLGIADYLIKTEFDPSKVLEKVNGFFGNHQNSRKENNAPLNTNIEAPKTENDNKNLKNKPTILIIEDDKFLSELVSQKLVKEGMKIILAITAEEALNVIKKEKPQLILLDIILPGMNGFEFLEKMRNDAKLSDIPVIVLSNLGEEKDKETAKKFGVKSFLVKAMNSPNEIVEEIRRVLERSYL